MDKDDTNKKLSGAVFEIWSAKESGEWTVEPDSRLGTYTTDANGHFIANLDYGIYFWREVQAPAGYAPEDSDYHSFRIIKGIPKYQFVIENVKTDVYKRQPIHLLQRLHALVKYDKTEGSVERCCLFHCLG